MFLESQLPRPFCLYLGLVHTPLTSALRTQRQAGHLNSSPTLSPEIHSEFQDSQSHIERTCLKQTKVNEIKKRSRCRQAVRVPKCRASLHESAACGITISPGRKDVGILRNHFSWSCPLPQLLVSFFHQTPGSPRSPCWNLC